MKLGFVITLLMEKLSIYLIYKKTQLESPCKSYRANELKSPDQLQ